jgi:hypothetical protein
MSPLSSTENVLAPPVLSFSFFFNNGHPPTRRHCKQQTEEKGSSQIQDERLSGKYAHLNSSAEKLNRKRNSEPLSYTSRSRREKEGRERVPASVLISVY